MGYYQDLDEDRGLDAMIEEEMREKARENFEGAVDRMNTRYHEAGRAQVGATIDCACCGRRVVKRSYQQRFCPPTGQGKGKRYRCKDRYWNAQPHRILRSQRFAK